MFNPNLSTEQTLIENKKHLQQLLIIGRLACRSYMDILEEYAELKRYFERGLKLYSKGRCNWSEKKLNKAKAFLSTCDAFMSSLNSRVIGYGEFFLDMLNKYQLYADSNELYNLYNVNTTTINEIGLDNVENVRFAQLMVRYNLDDTVSHAILSNILNDNKFNVLSKEYCGDEV